MNGNNEEIEEENLPERFAELFESKVKRLSDNAVICPNVYNGTNKVTEAGKQ